MFGPGKYIQEAMAYSLVQINRVSVFDIVLDVFEGRFGIGDSHCGDVNVAFRKRICL
jgi:hypothetical protein